MLGDLQKFSTVLQQLKQKHPNDPQLDQLKYFIVTPTTEKELIVFMRILKSELKLTCCK